MDTGARPKILACPGTAFAQPMGGESETLRTAHSPVRAPEITGERQPGEPGAVVAGEPAELVRPASVTR